eukprot:TRINITY_DN0_c1_g1_i2.p1 TRINITY_DN0_c1_g1~~TRINITY_DN0_c1_g1_i2.p1  ORF type:complete len:871 (+),score=319.19 TRINITY_DN0_c1_g1_i2:2395-5007(+)
MTFEEQADEVDNHIRAIKDHEEYIEKLKSQLASFSKARDLNDLKLKYAMDDLDLARQDVSNLNDKKLRLETSKRKLESELYSLRESLDQNKEIYTTLRPKVSQMDGEVNSLSIYAVDLENKNNSLQSQIKKLENEHKILTENLEQSTSDLNIAQAKNEKYTLEVKELKEKMTNKDYELRILENDLRRTTDELNRLIEKKKDALQRVKLMEEDVAEFTKKVKVVNSQLEDEQDLKKRAQKKVKDLQDKYDYEKQHAKPKVNMKALDETRLKLKDSVNILRSELEVLHIERVSTQKLAAEASEKIKELIAEKNNKSDGRASTLRLLEKMKKEISEKNDQYDQISTWIRKNAKRLREIQNEASKNNDQHETTVDRTQEVKELRDEMNSLKSDIQKDYKEARDLDNLARELEKEKSEEEILIEDMKKRILLGRENRENLELEITKTRNLLSHRKTSNNTNKEIIQTFDSKLNELKLSLEFVSNDRVTKENMKKELQIGLEDIRHSLDKERVNRLEAERLAHDAQKRLDEMGLASEFSEDRNVRKEAIAELKSINKQLKRLLKEKDEVDELVRTLRESVENLGPRLANEKLQRHMLELEIPELEKAVVMAEVDKDIAARALKRTELIVKDLLDARENVRYIVKGELEHKKKLDSFKTNVDEATNILQEEIDEVRRENKFLKKAKKELREENHLLKNEIDTERLLIEKTKQDRKEYRQKLKENEAMIPGLETLFEKLEEAVYQLEFNNKNLSDDLHDDKKKNRKELMIEAKLQAKISKFTARLSFEEVRARNETSSLDHNKSEIQRLTESVQSMRDELSTIKKRLREQKNPRRLLADQVLSAHKKGKTTLNEAGKDKNRILAQQIVQLAKRKILVK